MLLSCVPYQVRQVFSSGVLLNNERAMFFANSPVTMETFHTSEFMITSVNDRLQVLDANICPTSKYKEFSSSNLNIGSTAVVVDTTEYEKCFILAKPTYDQISVFDSVSDSCAVFNISEVPSSEMLVVACISDSMVVSNSQVTQMYSNFEE